MVLPIQLSSRRCRGHLASISLVLACAASGAQAATTRSWTSDGPNGTDGYTLIRNALGSQSIESPDIGPETICHTGRHIKETADAQVGNAFIFYLHAGSDCDPTGTTTSTRERVEIKVYDGSNSSLKGTRNTRMQYRWRFKIDSAMQISSRFTHLFQLKSVGGPGDDDSHPLLTFTGKSGTFRVQHGNSDTIIGGTIDWPAMRGIWIDADVDTTFADSGALKITLKRVSDGSTLYSYSGTRDMFKSGQYVRPKWGIYRETEGQSLNDAKVYFSNFSITRY